MLFLWADELDRQAMGENGTLHPAITALDCFSSSLILAMVDIVDCDSSHVRRIVRYNDEKST